MTQVRGRAAATAVLALALAALAPGCDGEGENMARRQEAQPDRILIGGHVVTGDPARPRAEAVALAGGRIVAVGSRAEVEALAGAGTEVEDLAGAVAVPGLVDAHGHVLGLGFDLSRVALRDVGSYQELVRRVAEQAGRQPAGSWVLGRGWDQSLWPGGGFPHHAELSEAVPGHPVLVNRIDGHAALANAAALAAAGISAETPDPEGGRILRDESGEPTGVLIDNAMALVERVVPPPGRQEQLAALDQAVHHLAALGLTAVHDAGVGYDPTLGLGDPGDPGWGTVDLYRDLLSRGRLPIRVYAMLGGNGAYPPQESYFERPPVIGEGDGMLTVRTVKLGVDGALGSRGAAMEQPYSDEPSGRGLLTRQQEVLDRLARRAFESGWQIAIHAIGDRANRMALDAIERARQAVPEAADARPRIEHAQVLAAVDLPRFAALGAVASVQPSHATSDRRWAEDRLGAERMAGAYAYASLARSGAVLACGSDFPVERADPLAGLQSAVARVDSSGEPVGGWRPEEALSAAAALECFTAGAAWASFMERESGRIAPGMRADITILDRDPLAVPATALAGLRVLQTIVGGRSVHRAPGP